MSGTTLPPSGGETLEGVINAGVPPVQSQPIAPSPSIAPAPQDPQPPASGLDDRLARLLKARSDALQKPRLDEYGREAIPALDKHGARMAALKAIQGNLATNQEFAPQLKEYLQGRRADLPDGWLPDDSPLPAPESAAARTQARLMQQYRDEHPVKGAIADTAEVGLNLGASAWQVVANEGIGVLNSFRAIGRANVEASQSLGLLKGVEAPQDIKPIDVKAAMLVAGRALRTVPGLLTGEGIKTPTMQQASDYLAGQEMSRGGVAEFSSQAAGFVGQALALAATLRLGRGTTLGQSVGKFAAYEVVTARGANNSAPTGADMAEHAVIGATAALLGHGATALGQRFSQWLLGKSSKWLAEQGIEKAQRAILDFTRVNGFRQVAGETQRAFLNRVATAFGQAGAPGLGVPVIRMIGYAAQGAIESVPLSLLNEKYRAKMTQAIMDGDAEAFGEAMKMQAAAAGGLAALHIGLNDLPRYQRLSTTNPMGRVSPMRDAEFSVTPNNSRDLVPSDAQPQGAEPTAPGAPPLLHRGRPDSTGSKADAVRSAFEANASPEASQQQMEQDFARQQAGQPDIVHRQAVRNQAVQSLYQANIDAVRNVVEREQLADLNRMADQAAVAGQMSKVTKDQPLQLGEPQAPVEPAPITPKPDPAAVAEQQAAEAKQRHQDRARSVERRMAELVGPNGDVIRLGWRPRVARQQPVPERSVLNRTHNDQLRAWTAEQAADLQGDATVSVNQNQARQLLRLLPSKGLRQQIDALLASDGNYGDIKITADEFRKMLAYHTKKAPRIRAEGEGEVSQQAINDAIDSFSRKALVAFGKDAVPSGGLPSEPGPGAGPDGGGPDAGGDGPNGPVIEVEEAPQFSYQIKNGVGYPSPALRRYLGIPAQMPAKAFLPLVETASLHSALVSKTILPGTVIDAKGRTAEAKADDQPGVQRVVQFDEVMQADLEPGAKWKKADAFPARGKDHIDEVQRHAVDAMRSVPNIRHDLPQGSMVVLGAAADLMETVSRSNDPAVEETLHLLPEALPALLHASPEHASKIIKVIAESLTTKDPDVALHEMVAQPDDGVTWRQVNPDGSVSIRYGDPVPPDDWTPPTGPGGSKPGMDRSRQRDGEAPDQARQPKPPSPPPAGGASGRRQSESGAVAVPQILVDAARGAADVAMGIKRRVIDPIFEDLPQEIGNYGGAVGKEIEQAAMKGEDFYHRQVTEVHDEAHAALRRAKGGGGYKDAVAELERQVELIPGSGITSAVGSILKDNGTVPGGAAISPRAQEILDDYHRMRMKLNDYAMEAGTVRQKPAAQLRRELAAWKAAGSNPATKPLEHEPFVTDRSRRYLLRTDPTPELIEAYRRPENPHNQEILSAIATANGINPQQYVQEKLAQARAREEVEKGKLLDKKTAVEGLRELTVMPDVVPTSKGPVKLRSGSMFHQYQSLLSSEIAGNSSRMALGQDLPAEYVQRHNYRKITPRGAIARMRQAMAGDSPANAGRAVGAVQRLIEQFEGNGEKSAFPGVPWWVSAPLRTVRKVFDSALLSGSAHQDLVENIRFADQAGLGRIVGGLLKTMADPRGLLAEIARAGWVMRESMWQSHGGGLGKLLLDVVNGVIRAPKTISMAISNMWVRKIGESIVQSLRDGNSTEFLRQTMENLNFTPQEQAALMSGRGPSELYDAFMSRWRSFATAEKRGSQSSRFTNNPFAKLLFRFVRWPVNAIGKLFRSIGNISRNLASGSMKSAAVATQKFIYLAGGAAVSGAAAMLMANIIRDRSLKNGWDDTVRQLTDGIWKPITRLLGTTYGGGPLSVLSRGGIEDAVKTIPLVGDSIAFVQAITGKGPYRNMTTTEAFGQYARNYYTATKYFALAGSALGLSSENADRVKAASAALSKFYRDSGKGFGQSAPVEEEDQAFGIAMRHMADAIVNHSDFLAGKEVSDKEFMRSLVEMAKTPAFQAAKLEALANGSGREIAASLRSKKKLPNDIKDRIAIREAIGDEHNSALALHDSALESVADVLGRMAGTDRHQPAPLDVSIKEAIKQVSLGDNGRIWKPIYEQVIDQASVLIGSQQDASVILNKLAEGMSQTPKALGEVFTGETLGGIKSMAAMEMNAPELAARLAPIMLGIAADRFKENAKKRALESAQSGR